MGAGLVMPSLDARKAVAAAAAFFKTLYEGVQYEDLLVEEIEFDDVVWKVTLGYSRRPSSPMALIDNLRVEREYKAFVVDATTFEVRSMKLRGMTSVD